MKFCTEVVLRSKYKPIVKEIIAIYLGVELDLKLKTFLTLNAIIDSEFYLNSEFCKSLPMCMAIE